LSGSAHDDEGEDEDDESRELDFAMVTEPPKNDDFAAPGATGSAEEEGEEVVEEKVVVEEEEEEDASNAKPTGTAAGVGASEEAAAGGAGAAARLDATPNVNPVTGLAVLVVLVAAAPLNADAPVPNVTDVSPLLLLLLLLLGAPGFTASHDMHGLSATGGFLSSSSSSCFTTLSSVDVFEVGAGAGGLAAVGGCGKLGSNERCSSFSLR